MSLRQPVPRELLTPPPQNGRANDRLERALFVGLLHRATGGVSTTGVVASRAPDAPSPVMSPPPPPPPPPTNMEPRGTANLSLGVEAVFATLAIGCDGHQPRRSSRLASGSSLDATQGRGKWISRLVCPPPPVLGPCAPCPRKQKHPARSARNF